MSVFVWTWPTHPGMAKKLQDDHVISLVPYLHYV